MIPFGVVLRISFVLAVAITNTVMGVLEMVVKLIWELAMFLGRTAASIARMLSKRAKKEPRVLR